MSEILKGLSAKEFINPEDKRGLERLDAVPGMKKFLAETISNIREKFITIEMMGDGVNITPESYPDLHSVLSETAKILDIDKIPDFSMRWSYDISIGTEGSKHPRISALSGAVDLLSDKELTFLIGHELGHLMAGHKPYHNLLITFYTPMIKMVTNAEVWLALLRPLLLQWYRLSDYTADKMSGIPLKYHDKISPEAFLKQAVRFEQNNRGFADNIIQNLTINTACAPWLVVRAAKLYEWYKSGEYDELIKKHSI